MSAATSPALQRLKPGRKVGWRTILGLLLVPLTAAGVLLWGLWNPTDRLETVTAAVVNLDEPVEVDGQLVPLGRVLAAELIDGDADTNFTWLLTDESDAAAGLKEGLYSTIVTIPANFSEAATSTSQVANDPASAADIETATIGIETSERGRLLDAALSNIVTSTATNVLNQQLGAQFVGGIFVGMTELGNGLGDAADGASQLATGTSELATGTQELATGTHGLANGSQQLASGTSDLASGASQLASGTGALASGANDLAAGATDLASGMRLFATGDAGANPGLTGLASGVTAYTNGVNGMLDGLLNGADQSLVQLEQLRTDIADGTIPVADPVVVVGFLDDAIDTLESATSADSGIAALKGQGTQLASGLQQAAAGADQLAAGAEGLAGGASQLASGANELSAGTSGLAAGASELAVGTQELATGTQELAEGTQGLADGTSGLAKGTDELASGLNEAVEQIPSYTDAQTERLSEAIVQPVEAVGADDELFNASGVPLFAGIALWAGAFASFLVLAPLWRRTREAARGVAYITWRSALPALLLGLLQGAIVGLILPLLLGYSFSQGAGFFTLALLAGAAFSLVNQGLSALLGGFGRFISFALLVIAFAIGVISTAPAPLQAIGDASPIGALVDGLQAVAMQTSGVAAAMFVLVLWGAAGAALSAFAVARKRRAILVDN